MGGFGKSYRLTHPPPRALFAVMVLIQGWVGKRKKVGGFSILVGGVSSIVYIVYPLSYILFLNGKCLSYVLRI